MPIMLAMLLVVWSLPAQAGYCKLQGEIIYEIDIDGKREWLAQTATVKNENLSAGHISYSEIGFPYFPFHETYKLSWGCDD
jgi:hypothetical protein